MSQHDKVSIMDIFGGYEAGPVLRERTPNLNRTVSNAEDMEGDSLESPEQHKAQIALMRFLSNVANKNNVGDHVYVVGGAVRNYFLDPTGRKYPIKDLDIVIDTVALAGRFRKKKDSEWFAKVLQREIPAATDLTTNQYGVAILTIKGQWILEGHNLNGEVIEIANARSESYGGKAGKGYKPDEVTPATIDEDLLRREFNFNTLLWRLQDLAEGPDKADILDLTGCGIDDINNMNMRCPREPDVVFSDDPTRMLRLIKFSTKYGFNIPKDVADSVKRNADKMREAPWEAIATIFINNVINEPTAISALRTMKELGLLDAVLRMAKKQKPFASFLSRQLRGKNSKILLELLDLGFDVSTPLNFLSGDQQDKLREISDGMEEDELDAFVDFLKKPRVNNSKLIEDFGLKGPERASPIRLAREALLNNPELIYDDDSLDSEIRSMMTHKASKAHLGDKNKLLKRSGRMVKSEGLAKAARCNSFTSPLAQNRLRKRALGLTDIPAASTPGNQAFRGRDEYGEADLEASFRTGFGGQSDLSNFLESEDSHPTNIDRKDDDYNNQFYGDKEMKAKDISSLASHLRTLGHGNESRRVMGLAKYAQAETGRARLDALLGERMPNLTPFRKEAKEEPLTLFLSSLTDQKAKSVISALTGGAAALSSGPAGMMIAAPISGIMAPLYGLAAGVAAGRAASYLTKKVMELGGIGTDEDRMLAALYYGDINNKTPVGDKTVNWHIANELKGDDLTLALYILKRKEETALADELAQFDQDSQQAEITYVAHPSGTNLREGQYRYKVVGEKKVVVTLTDGREFTWTPDRVGLEKWNEFATNLNALTPTEQASGGGIPRARSGTDEGSRRNEQRGRVTPSEEPKPPSAGEVSGRGFQGNEFYIAKADDGSTFVAIHKGTGKLYSLTKTQDGYSGVPIYDRDRGGSGPGYLTRSEQRRLLSEVRSAGESGDRLKAFRRIISGQRMGERGGIFGTGKARGRGARRQQRGVSGL